MVLPSQHVSYPIFSTAIAKTNDNFHHIPLNAISLSHKPIPLYPNCSLESNQSPNLAILDSSPVRPIIAHLDFSAQNPQPKFAQASSPHITDLPVTSSPAKNLNPFFKKSPYNTRTPKKPSLSFWMRTLSLLLALPTPPLLLLTRKGQEPMTSPSPQKKVLAPPLSSILFQLRSKTPFCLSFLVHMKRSQLELCSRLLEKGKKKLVSAVVVAEDDPTM